MLEKGIYELLTQDAGILAAVAKQPDNTPCVFWNQQLKAGGTQFPSVVLTRVTTRNVYSMSGSSGLSFVSIQIDCYDKQLGGGYYGARALAVAVRNLLKSFRGNLPDADATPVLGCVVTREMDFPVTQGAQGFIYRVMLEVTFQVQDTFLPVSSPNNPFIVIDGGTE